MAYSFLVHRREVSEAVRQLRAELHLTQQAFAVKMNTAVTTIARWETTRSPRGRTLNELMREAEESGRPDLATVFRKELMAELGFALRSQFRYAVQHQRQAASGADALRSVVKELRLLSEVFNQANVTRENAIQAGKNIEQHVRELEALVAAATDVDSPRRGPKHKKSQKNEPV